ncbi:MAG: PIG-L family deacetylase [Rhodobacteraceae bacterium]|nr:PIG-L family deacetylase [Paracoccaceae bacterium]MCW9044082.1 PIG-L family deacetylase [Pseudopelagicola sp.]
MLNLFQGARALFLAPHTDDVELGCGATLARCVEEAETVDVAVFSTAADSLPEGSDPDRLKLEFLKAMEQYNIPPERLHVYDYRVRRLNYSRQEVLEDLVQLRNSIRPNIVFTPSGGDVHQDHQVVHNESLRAFKTVTMLGYELPWNHFHFETRVFVSVTEAQIAQKLRALEAYESQIEKSRGYFDEEFIKGLARVRGIQQGVPYSEAFELITLKV